MENENSNGTRHSTLDLWAAAYQVARGNPVELELSGSTVIFLFAPGSAYSRINEEFNADAPVGVRSYASACRTLRARMIAARPGGGGAMSPKSK
jgi:hypothetical protein